MSKGSKNLLFVEIATFSAIIRTDSVAITIRAPKPGNAQCVQELR